MEKIFLVLTIFISLSNSQIAYPEEHRVGHNQSTSGMRGPVYVPGVCPPNQWYWPGNQDTDWICDCATRFVYYPPTDMCHELYRQGPCETNQYLILTKGKIIPECVQNPCRYDTMVPFKGKCHRLYKTDACPPLVLGGGTLNVNHTSLTLECIPENAVELNIIEVASGPCPPGSKRSTSGQCRIVVGG